MRLRLWLHRFALVLVVSAGLLLSSSNALAADQVVLKYRIFHESISVKDLSTFAETGQLSTLLRVNLALGKQDPKVIRQYLTQPVSVNPVFLDQVLNSPVGNIVADQISQFVHTPSERDDRQAIHTALVLSASQDHNISLIETIQNYPTSVVEVEGDHLESAYSQLHQLEGRLQDLLHSPR